MKTPDLKTENKIPTILETRAITKIFGGLIAVNQFDLNVRTGEIASLIGPNGAGKTTVFNAVTGIYRPEEGQILFKGKDITGKEPHRIVARGIARTFQNIRLFATMTCLENVMAGRHCRTSAGLWSSIFQLARQQKEERKTLEIAKARLRQVGLWEARNELAKNIAYGSRRMLEIARALATEPTLLVLDEPSSGLNPRETEDLMAFLKDIIQQENLTILLIEHDMNMVMGISDRVTVMDGGQKIAEGTPSQIYCDSCVIKAYLGAGDAEAE